MSTLAWMGDSSMGHVSCEGHITHGADILLMNSTAAVALAVGPAQQGNFIKFPSWKRMVACGLAVRRRAYAHIRVYVRTCVSRYPRVCSHTHTYPGAPPRTYLRTLSYRNKLITKNSTLKSSRHDAEPAPADPSTPQDRYYGQVAIQYLFPRTRRWGWAGGRGRRRRRGGLGGEED